MRVKFDRMLAVSLGAISMALVAEPAFANEEVNTSADPQASDTTLGEIVVTARKVGESAQSLPITISAFTSDELQSKVILSAADLQTVTPGLTISNNATGGVPVFAIRGTSTELGIDGGVALYFNDVPLISTVGMMYSFYDVSTVEILKGPQGTQFGTNTTGGTISVRTKRPTSEFEASLKAGYGNFNRREFEGMVNIPVNDVIGFRFAGNYVKRDGYVKNLDAAPGFPSSYQDENHYSLRGTMSIDTGPLKNDLIVDYYNRDEAPYVAVPVKFAPSLSGMSLPALGAKLGTYNTIHLGPNVTGRQPDLFGKASLYGIQNRTELEVSDNLSLRNVFGYRNDDTHTHEVPPGISVVTTDVQRQDKASQWTDDLTLRYENSDIGLKASVGGYYSFLRRTTGINANVLQGIFAGFAGFPVAPGSSITLGDVFPGLANYVVSVNNFETKEIRSKAIYANAEYELTDTLGVQGGFRYNWDTVNSNVTAGSNLANPNTPLGSLPIFGADFKPTQARPCDTSSLIGYPDFDPAYCSASRGAKFKAPSWLFGITNKFSDRVLGYAKISHGYLAGGTNFTLRDAGRTTFEPEKNTMIEVGVKADWELGDRPIRTNVALYHGRISNKQVFANANYPNGGTGFGVVNAAKETVYGLDFELRFSPVDRLTLDLNYNYIHAKFDEFIYPGLGGPAPDPSYVPPVDLSGATPAQTPKHQLNGSITYDWGLAEGQGSLSTTVSGYYTSSITQANRLGDFDRAAGGELNTLAGYFLANGSINWSNVMNSPVSLQIWGRNLFNKHYGTASQVQFATFGYGTVTFGPPRTFGATVSVAF
ncbi:TonB-dependent receptor [Novosphingobium taihuense]|uniref:Outer membrane receptor protein involved in Fe transport n=1 Tax=Novosphingobium taihuense TaxID=260085 RepID=A0A7W7ADV3_9SPHN|nr:TonB-dependent receptor [Novosphingobium taihuense]MBB4614307.1 outer membrane receptor protein involved in Fe transport [Novosphingobium taihuense]TWH87153.1 outer membrane receptor protein involved in Fe transport [Novosphingobium taihuense]